MLSNIFFDIEYVNEATNYQQEESMQRTPEEHAVFLKQVEKITNKVRKEYKKGE